MIFPIRPITTEIRRVDDVNVRATPAVNGITAVNGFNQPGVVVTIGDGARTLARFGQQPQSGATPDERRLGTSEERDVESVFDVETSDVGTEERAVEAVFDNQKDAPAPASARPDSTRGVGEDDEAFGPVWAANTQEDESNAVGVPYAALQRAASVQDLDVEDVAQALSHTQIAVRVLATRENLDANARSDEVDAPRDVADDAATITRQSTLPTDGVPYEALQRAVTEAENAQSGEHANTDAELTEPVFLPPENGGAPWGRAVPFEDEVNALAERDQGIEHTLAARQERPPELLANA